ncbi:MAG TPA: NUDIX domain-containing protein [Ktedonobacteraceae bacterium]|nr:NUDIX domain-containing protein [Ktedonobacteraceae bacterium]
MIQKSRKRPEKQLKKYPQVGVGVIITKGDQVLLMKRKGSHGDGAWSMVGGHLEFGESLEECAIREVKEEVAVTITDITFRAITNDLFETEGKHYVTIWMEGRYVSGEPLMQAVNEMSAVSWFSWNALPEPLFLPLEHLLTGRCYPALWYFNE